MNVLHLLGTGDTGGIETLVRDYAKNSKLNNTFVFFFGGGETCNQMKDSGNNVIELNTGKSEYIKAYYKIKKIVDDLDIDAIIVHHESPVIYIFMTLLKREKRCLKTYIYAHCNMNDMMAPDRKGVIIRKIIISYAYKKCDYVIAISNSVKKSIRDNGFNTDKVRVVYNGIDCQKFCGPKVINRSEVRLIFVGRLIKQKGINILLEALKKIDDKSAFSCMIVGDGPERHSLESFLRSLNFKNNVQFLGTRSDVPKLLQNADVFVHPAIWEEGFGIAVVEAMAAGVVPIAFNKGAIPEIISNSEDGFIVEECNADALAKAIEKAIVLFEKRELYEFSEKARKKALDFDIGKFVRELDDAFRV